MRKTEQHFVFIIRLLIDLNRIPFDLIEGESELVSAFNLEYYRRLFIYIFLSDSGNPAFLGIFFLRKPFGVQLSHRFIHT